MVRNIYGSQMTKNLGSLSLGLKKSLLDNIKQDVIDIHLSPDKGAYMESLFVSFLIGVNGVGKSSILRGFIDFFIYFHEYCYGIDKVYRKTVNKNVQVVGVRYRGNRDVYDVWKNDNEKKFFVNDSI